MKKTPSKPRQILVELRSPIIEKFMERCERDKRKPKNLAEFLIEQGINQPVSEAETQALLEKLIETAGMTEAEKAFRSR